MLTERGRDSEVRRGLEEGADAYISKPFATQELIARVHALIAAARA